MAPKTKRSTKYLRKLYLKSKILPLAIIILLVISTFLLVRETKFYQSIFTSASVGQATIFLEPDTSTLPPSSSVDVWITVDQAAAFSHIELYYDSQVIELIAEPDYSSSPMTRIINSTSMSEANSTGKIIFTLGLEPSQLSSAPTGAFKLATFKFSTTTSSFTETLLSIDTSTTQLVDVGATPFQLTFSNSLLILNPTPAPSPQQDEVTIQSVEITSSKNFSSLAIVANSTLAPDAVLTVEGFGELKYDKRSRTYKKKFRVKGSIPTEIIVTSNYGGSDSYLIPSN